MAVISPTDVFGMLLGAGSVAVVIIWIFYGLKHVFTYRLQNLTMEIRMFGITVRRVFFSEIDRVDVIPFAALVPFSRSFRWNAFFSWKWCGYSKKVVVIKRRTGLVKKIIISPGDPESFADSLTLASGGRSFG